MYSQNIDFEVTVDRVNVSLGRSIQLSLTFHGVQDASVSDLPDIEGFNWQYLGPSTRMSIVNGKVASSITHIYTLLPLKAGKLEIPSFSLQYKGKTYSSKPISIEVVQGPVSYSANQEEQHQEIASLEDRVFLTMEVGKRKAYINEIIPVTIKLYVNRLAIRDIQYPELSADGFSTGKFAQALQYRDTQGGIVYDIFEFNTDVFAIRSGDLKLGAANLKCDLIMQKESRRRSRPIFDDDFSSFFDSDVFDNFFTRYERYPLNLKSPDIPMQIKDLPLENRPDSFNGAVGEYNFYLGASPDQVKVGDPITLKMAVTGVGNFDTVIPPPLDFKDNFKIYEPQTKQDENSKSFEQVIIPKYDNIKEIPQVSFSFFDPKSQSYKTTKRGPMPVNVLSAPSEYSPRFIESPDDKLKLPEDERLGRDIVYIKDSPGKFRKNGAFLYKNKAFVLFQALPFALLFLTIYVYKKKERLKTDLRYARLMRAPSKAREGLKAAQKYLNEGKVEEFYDAIFKTLKEYLGNRFHLPPGGITFEVAEGTLRLRKINEGILNNIKDIFQECDMARYAPFESAKSKMDSTLDKLREVINSLEKKRL